MIEETDRSREYAGRREELDAAFRVRGEEFRGPILAAKVGDELLAVLNVLKSACAEHGAAVAALGVEFDEGDGVSPAASGRSGSA